MISNQGKKYLELKQKTNRDKRDLGPAVQFRDSDVTVAGQTTYTLSFAVPIANKDQFKLHIDGSLLMEGSTKDFEFIEISNGASSKIQLTSSPVAGLDMDYELSGVRLAPSPNVSSLQADINNTKTRLHGKIVTKSADYTISDADTDLTILVDDTSTDRTITLPTAADNLNKVITIKNVSTDKGKVTVDGEGSETIDGYTTIILDFKNCYIKVQSDGSNWHIINENITSPQKQYTMTVTGTNWTTDRAIGIPYRTMDGRWRLRFNIAGTVSSGVTTLDISVTGIDIRQPSTRAQAISVLAGGSAPYTGAGHARTGVLISLYSTTSSTSWEASGDVELDEKPTFVE